MKKYLPFFVVPILFFRTGTYSQITVNSFTTGYQFGVGTQPYGLALDDLDGDGKIDIVTANSAANSISILRNQTSTGVINPASFQSAVAFATGNVPWAVAVGDLDGDGKKDIVTANTNGNSMSVFLNTSVSGTINNSSFAAKVDFSTASNPQSIALGDMDGDGKLDVVVSNNGAASISVFRNTSITGTVSFATKYDKNTGGGAPHGLALADFDGDGLLDVTVAGVGSFGYTYFFRNLSVVGGVALNTAQLRAWSSSDTPRQLAVGDLNGDGKLDVVSHHDYQNSTSQVAFTTNTSVPGTIAYSGVYSVLQSSSYNGSKGVAIADMDQDGKMDVVAASHNTFPTMNQARILRNISTGTGTLITANFFQAAVVKDGGGVSSIYGQLKVADIDNDGRPDIVMNNSTDNNVSVIKNVHTYSNTIQTANPSTFTTCPQGTMLVTYNCSAAFTGTNVFTVELSDSAGSFASPTSIGTVTSAVAGTLLATIPSTALVGTQYRIRVVSDSPVIVGSDNGTNITINSGINVGVSIATASMGLSCGGTITLTATPVNGGTPAYSWKKNGSTFSTVGPTVATSSYVNNDVFSLVLTSNLVCAVNNPATSNLITMTVNSFPSQPSVISGTSSPCQGATTLYSVTAVNGMTYNWSVPGGWTGSSTTNTINATAGTSGGILSVSAVNFCGISSARNFILSVSPPPSAPVSISGASNICSGVPINYSIAAVAGATSYSWTLPGGWSGSSSGTNINATADPNSGVITVAALNSCGSSAAQTLAVNVTGNTLPAPSTINGNISVCPASSNIYSVSPMGGATSYTWTSPGGWSGSSASNVLSVFAGGSGVFSVSAVNACGIGSVQTLSVTVNPNPLVSITGPASVCVGATANLTANGASTYSWSATAGGAVGSTVAVSPSSNASYSVTGTDLNGCVGTALQAITVNSLPTISVNNGTICSGNAFVISPSGASTYTYSSGSATVFPSSNASYTVTGASAAGCQAATGAVANVVVNTSPTISVNSGNICAGGVFTLSPSGAVSFTFSAGSNTVSPNVSTNYSVTGTGTSGCVSAPVIAQVNVLPLPTITVNSGSICAGQNFTINAGGAFSYTYSGGASLVSPATNTTYAVTGTGTNGCVSAAPAISGVTVSPLPNITVNSGSICAGSSFNINAGGAFSYTYSGGSAIVNPSVNASYSVTGTSVAGCISNSAAIAAITVQPLPTITVNSGTVCSGLTYTLSPSGAFSYTYSSGSNMVTPLANTNYSVIGTSSAGCISATAAVASISVVSLPTISVNSGSICAGQAFTLNASGASSYTYTGGNNIVTPQFNASYSVTGTSSLGCVGANTAIANIVVAPLPVISASSGSICAGNNFVISVSGASSYTFSGGSATVSPNGTTAYSVSGTSSLGCVSATAAISNIAVFPLPTITVNSGTICFGSSFTLNAGGAFTYTYQGGSNVVAPVANNNYTVSGTSAAGCIAPQTAMASITVVTLPQVSVNSGTICAGQFFTMVPSGISTFTISGGSNVVSPVNNATYAVTGTSSVGCISSNTAVASVSVFSLPVLSVNSGTVCMGSPFVMTPGGAFTYTFSSGSATVTPLFNTSYSVSGTSSAGCVAPLMAVSNVTVFNLPVLNVSGSNAVCLGNSGTLSVSGALSYTWSINSNNTTINVSPIVNSTYTVYGTDANGCVNSAQRTVSVIPLPVVTAAASSSMVCQGSPVTLFGGGALTYSWTGGATNALPFTPTASASYTVTGTDVNGCQGTAFKIIIVNPLPVVTTSASSNPVCLGSPVTLQGQGAQTYVWSGGVSNNVSFSPNVTAAYTVTGTDANGCVNTAAVTVTVNVLPIVTIKSSQDPLCAGESATLTASGANLYSWNTGATNAVISVTPTSSNNYTLTGTDANGCVNTASYKINVVDCTGLDARVGSTETRVYPNPFNGEFTIVAEGEGMTFEVYNNAGQILFDRRCDNKIEIVDLREYPNGIYLVRVISTSGAVMQRRLIKQ